MGAAECEIEVEEPNYPYDRQTLELVSALADRIKSCSADHGVPPVAVAGSIADEYNVQRDLRRVWDWFQDEIFQRTPSWIIQMNYRMGLKSRLFNVTRNDIGRGNINIATAREMYVKNKNACGLNLDDWMWLVNYILSQERF